LTFRPTNCPADLAAADGFFGGVDAGSGRDFSLNMFRLRLAHAEIFGGVVVNVAVDVMNDFSRCQGSPNLLLGGNAMDILTADPEVHGSVLGGVFAATWFRTEPARAFPFVTRPYLEGLTASFAQRGPAGPPINGGTRLGAEGAAARFSTYAAGVYHEPLYRRRVITTCRFSPACVPAAVTPDLFAGC
jgi:hypothetical protein